MIYSLISHYQTWPAQSWLAGSRLVGTVGHAGLGTLRRACITLACAVILAGAALLAGPAVAAESAPPQAPAPTVNINTANAADLAAGLRGIGDARAQEIVRHREAYGPFSSVDELAEVKGIGKATLDMNRKVITLE